MAKNYSYVIDHDTGFAPMVHSDVLCTLSGCKSNTVEKYAEQGSWILGTGGKNTGVKGKIIYFMEVAMNYPIDDFRSQFLEQSKYLENIGNNNVLVSRNFNYFGDRAIDLPKELEHLHHGRWGCKCFDEAEKDRLLSYIRGRGFKPGMIGKPNNPR